MFIYLIVCSESLKLYVGQHKGEDLQHYLQQKLYEAKTRRDVQSRLYAAMRKYSRESWSIHSLCGDVQSRQALDELERHFIKVLKVQHPDVGYNICRGGEGGSSPHGFHHSAATKRKMRLKALGNQRGLGVVHHWTPEMRQRASEAHKGKKLTKAHRKNISAANKGKQNTLGHVLTVEHKDKIRQALLGRKFTPEWRAKISAAKMGNNGARVRWDRIKAAKEREINGLSF